VQDKPSEMRFPNGESFIEVRDRAVAEIERIAAAHDEKDMVACFSHGDIIRLAVIAHFLAVPLDEFQRVGANPASISVIHIPRKAGRMSWRMSTRCCPLSSKKKNRTRPAGGNVEGLLRINRAAAQGEKNPSDGAATGMSATGKKARKYPNS
jgi:hypothetical protein